MTRAQVRDALDGHLPVRGLSGRPDYGRVLEAVGYERANLARLTEITRLRRPDHPKLGDAELLLARMDVRLQIWLNDWRPEGAAAN